jgi:RNA polymerase sigma-70 factor (ECF subfamily)
MYTPADQPDDENVTQLFLFIEQLPLLDKALVLLYLDDYSHKEIGEVLGISISNVGTKINRIKIKLKDFFINLKKI